MTSTSKKRIMLVAKQLDLNFTYAAAKPSRKALKELLKKHIYPKESIAIIGDRIFTDILAGKRFGIYTVLVRPISKDSNKISSNKFQKIEKYIARLIGGI